MGCHHQARNTSRRTPGGWIFRLFCRQIPSGVRLLVFLAWWWHPIVDRGIEGRVHYAALHADAMVRRASNSGRPASTAAGIRIASTVLRLALRSRMRLAAQNSLPLRSPSEAARTVRIRPSTTASSLAVQENPRRWGVSGGFGGLTRFTSHFGHGVGNE